MLKAKISQTKSNLYAVKTTKYDTTDIELIVETTDSSPWLNPKFELLGIKSDGHEVRQTENFKVIDLNNHIVQVTLDEQLVTCEGNVDLQLLIKDGSRKSSTPFKLHVGRSLDSDILESHRNVKVLDELEKYIIEGREYISEATELAQSTANYVQAVNTQAEANEAQRLQNESQRQSAETKRKEAEDGRKQAEVLRVQNEDTRQSAEVIRIANEQTRLENESNRVERETARENKESIRQEQEQQRHTSESTRQSQEATRQSNEDNRKQAEKSRSQEETIRINNEATRKQAEDARQSQELDRQSAESTRSTAETNRNNAESTRTQNENTRQSQETSRITNEQERVQQEQERVNNENTRKTEEAKRVEAEELRKEAYTEATQLLEELRNFEPITENDRTDYMGNIHQTLKAKNDADVDWLLGEINTVHYDGQHITATDTIEGRSKSAILKGQTLVNLAIEKGIVFTKANQWKHLGINQSLLNSSKKYLISFDSSHNFNGYTHLRDFATNQYITDSKRASFKQGNNKVLIDGFLQTDLNTFSSIKITFWLDGASAVFPTISNVILLEYQEGMENWDIPYFEGMQSVKMPVLTTSNGFEIFKTGMTLDEFDYNLVELNNGCISIPDSHSAYIKTKKEYTLLPNQSYVVRVVEVSNFNNSNYNIRLKIGDRVLKTVAEPLLIEELSKNSYYDIVYTNTTGEPITGVIRVDSYFGSYKINKIYIGEEPYKSNILTVNEDIELRGIGDVQDTLDCLTGEVTERVGEIVLDGSEDWVLSGATRPNHLRLYCFEPRFKQYQNVINDRFADNGNIQGRDIEGVYITNTIDIQVEHSRLSEVSVDGFKNWLRENNIKVQARLSQESVKTVDLSDNHVYSYKDVTHYDCSSAEGSLVPTLSIDVPTNLSALVSRQRATIVDQKNQIKLLEETNSELIISQETQDEEIVTNMLASVELFEMVLSMAPLSIDMLKSMGVNPMVEVYVTLILKGEKTIEQVPAVIRDKVQAQLDLLTK